MSEPGPATSAARSTPAARLSQISGQLQRRAHGQSAADGAASSGTCSAAPGRPAAARPDLILFFAWTAPSRAALAYFSSKYAQLYPGAQLLIFIATLSEFMPWPLTTAAFRERDFEEALAAVAAVQDAPAPLVSAPLPLQATPSAAQDAVVASSSSSGPSSSPRPHILVHVFSNGGAVRLATFAALYRRRFGAPLPAAAYVMDSCLTRGNIADKAHVVRDHVFLPSWPRGPRLVLWVPFLLVIWLAVVWMRVTGEVREGSWEKWAWWVLNDEAYVGDAPRLYMQGTADEVVPPSDSEAHAAAARQAGRDVRYETFEGAVHTASARSEPARYWRCVQEVWEKGMRGEVGEGELS